MPAEVTWTLGPGSERFLPGAMRIGNTGSFQGLGVDLRTRGAQRFVGTLDPTQAPFSGRYFVEKRGSSYQTFPFSSRYGADAYRLTALQRLHRAALEEGERGIVGSTTGGEPTGRGPFSMVAYGDTLRAKYIDPALAGALGDIAARIEREMQYEALRISPVDTGSYRASVHFRVDFTPGGKQGSQLIIRGLVGAPRFIVAPGPPRDARAYAMFVEFGGGHTPAYAIIRRTLDWGFPRLVFLLRQRFGQRVTAGPAFNSVPAGA